MVVVTGLVGIICALGLLLLNKFSPFTGSVMCIKCWFTLPEWVSYVGGSALVLLHRFTTYESNRQQILVCIYNRNKNGLVTGILRALRPGGDRYLPVAVGGSRYHVDLAIRWSAFTAAPANAIDRMEISNADDPDLWMQVRF